MVVEKYTNVWSTFNLLFSTDFKMEEVVIFSEVFFVTSKEDFIDWNKQKVSFFLNKWLPH